MVGFNGGGESQGAVLEPLIATGEFSHGNKISLQFCASDHPSRQERRKFIQMNVSPSQI